MAQETVGAQEPDTHDGNHGNESDQEDDHATTDETAVVVVDASTVADDSTSLTSTTSREGLRRTSGKIADLRAAFEKEDGSNGLTPSPKRVGRSGEQETEVARLQSQQTADITKLKEEHEAQMVSMAEKQEAEMMELKQRLKEEMVLRHEYEEKYTSLEDQCEELQSQLVRRDSEWQTELERRSNGLRKERNLAQEEASTVHRQLFELKRSISTSTRVENQVSDSTFAQEFQNLYHETQNWIVNNFRKVKIDKTPEALCARLESIVEPKQLEYLRPVFERYDQSIKLAALQAVAVSYLMEIFEEPLLFGMPTQPDWRKHLKKTAETLPGILQPAAYNKWRSFTLDFLRQCDQIRESSESAATSMAEMICITLNAITDAETSGARVGSLHAIIKRAISLAHLFRIQRAQYDFKLPSAAENFSTDSMEDTSVDGEATEQRVVRCATFPAVVKVGDENGDNVQLSNVVVKAKVVCDG